jgi:hypothetical protein
MKTNTGCKGAARLNLYQCEMLVASGMISKCGKKDYEHDEVISRLIELQANKDERNIKALMRNLAMIPADETPPPIPYDSYLSPEEIEEYGLNIPF